MNQNVKLSQNFRQILVKKEHKIEALEETLNLLSDEQIKLSFGNSTKERHFFKEHLRCFDVILQILKDELSIELEKANYELSQFIQHNTFDLKEIELINKND